VDGYIKLHRKILDNPIVCKDSDYFAVWGYLLLNATHKECQTMFKGNKIMLQPGQLLTGRKSIANQFKVDESKVQRVLKKLEIEHQIEQQTSNENRLITILNWSEYQQSEQQIELPVNNECTTDEQRVNTNKNVKNVKNIKNKEHQKKYSDDSFEMKCVKYLISSIETEMPNAKLPDTDSKIENWCDAIEKMVRIDKRTQEDVYNTLLFARSDTFWKVNIRSTSKFRERYETLYLQMKSKKEPKQQQKPSNNKFNQFPQRDYSETMDSIEQKLLRR
jgi:DNA-binding MarR family transcriptional regulator